MKGSARAGDAARLFSRRAEGTRLQLSWVPTKGHLGLSGSKEQGIQRGRCLGQRRGRRPSSGEGRSQTLDRRRAGRRWLTDSFLESQVRMTRLALTLGPGAGVGSRFPRKQDVCGFEGADGTSLAWSLQGGSTWPLAELPVAAAPGPAGNAGLPPSACSTWGVLGPNLPLPTP